MSSLRDFVKGVASSVAAAVSESASRNLAANVVKTCCQQLGWSIDEYLNAHEVCLHFNDPLLGIRKVVVGIGDHGTLVGFTVLSSARIPAEQVPAAALGYLLQRNINTFVAWQMCVRDDGNVAFALNYCVLATGLHGEVFKLLCETLVKEAYEFDAKMEEARLLR